MFSPKISAIFTTHLSPKTQSLLRKHAIFIKLDTSCSLRSLLSLTAALLLLLKSSPSHAHTPSLTPFVNPFIGTSGHRHTFPGANTRIDGSWDGCNGYHYSDSLIYGFNHTHLNGTGVSDYGDMHFMPVQNPEAWSPAKVQRRKELPSTRGSAFT